MSTTTVAAAAKMNSFTAAGVTILLSTCVVANAFRQKKQFYPSVVYICKSNPSMAVIYMHILVCIYMMGKCIGKIFFGTLRAAESERLIEKAWYAVTETCLAFTIFKDDLSLKFVGLFTVLLFLKCFHWLAEDRVDYMERTPVISYLFHVRIWALLTLLTVSDLFFVRDAYIITLAKGPSVQLVFGFEYALLITIVANAAVKYVLHSVDVHSNTFWESKTVLLLYLEFIIGFCNAGMYVLFLIIMVRTYTIPLFAFRPMYHTLRNFKKAFQDLLLSRRAIHNMNTLYPNATESDLQAIENVCIICREDMAAGGAKKMPCNHIFHTSCLRRWFQRHQTCPTCRLDILRPVSQPSATVPTAAAATAPTTAAATAAATATATATSPTPAGNAQATTSTNGSTNDSYNQGQSFVHGQTGSNDNFNYNQIPLQYQFRHLQQQTSSLNENNSNNNDNNLNNGIPQNNMNDFQPPFMNTTLLDNMGPHFFVNFMPQDTSNTVPPFPLNCPFVGGVAFQPPIMPANLDTLSDEELHVMEQNTRRGCLARLKYITDIKCMLDASIMMMNHYSSACLIAGLDSNDSSNTSASETKTSDTTENDDKLETRPPSNTSSEVDSSSSSENASSCGSDDLAHVEETEQQRLMRLKRLEKFSTGSNST